MENNSQKTRKRIIRRSYSSVKSIRPDGTPEICKTDEYVVQEYVEGTFRDGFWRTMSCDRPGEESVLAVFGSMNVAKAFSEGKFGVCSEETMWESGEDDSLRHFACDCGFLETDDSDKCLLVEDLCHRLPYNVECEVIGVPFRSTLVAVSRRLGAVDVRDDEGTVYTVDISKCKPILRRMSSMSPVERKQMFSLVSTQEIKMEIVDNARKICEWLDKNGFDHRNLIDRGLAKDANE